MSSSLRIIVVRLSALGDVVLAQSAIFGLRHRFPNAAITWVIDERFRSVADAIAGIRVVAIPKPRSLRDYVQFRRQMGGERYDILLAMQANARVNLLYTAIHATRKIGFDPRRARDLHRWFVTETIERRDEHLLDGFNQFVAKIPLRGEPAIRPADLVAHWPDFAPSPAIEQWFADLAIPPRYAVLHLGASKPERCWSAERHGQLATFFQKQPEISVLLTGGNSPAERAAGEAFCSVYPAVQNLRGKTSFAQLARLISTASVVISPDTATVHLARAREVPVVGMYAVARAELSGPYQTLNYTVDRYAEAVRQIAHRDPAGVDWHFRVHSTAAMDLIDPADVWRAFRRAWDARVP